MPPEPNRTYYYEARSEPREDLPPVPKSARSLTASFLLSSGMLVTGFGLACIFAGHLSWNLVRVVRALRPYDIDFVTLSLTGMVLFALGLVARTRTRVEIQQVLQSQGDEDAITDSMAELVAEIRELRYSSARLEQLVDQLRHQRVEVTAVEPGTGNLDMQDITECFNQQQDALFRLAASMDQLDARTDRRQIVRDEGLRSHMQELESHLSRVTQVIAQTQDSLTAAQKRHRQAQEAAVPTPPQMVALEPERAPEPPPEPPDLGLLDRLEQAPATPSPALSEPTGPANLDFDELDAESTRASRPNVDQVPPALPSEAPEQSWDPSGRPTP